MPSTDKPQARKTVAAIVSQGRAIHMTGLGWAIRPPCDPRNSSRTVEKTLASRADIEYELEWLTNFAIPAWVE